MQLSAFDSCVDRSAGADACWPWTRGRTTAGYGQALLNGRVVYAHRHALERAEGRPLAADEKARHRCDNPPCCNPKHLQRGTSEDNTRDSIERGRFFRNRHPKAACKHGHAFTPDNTKVRVDGTRECRTCVRRHGRHHYHRHRRVAN